MWTCSGDWRMSTYYGMKNPNLIFPAAYCTYVTHDDAKCQMAFVILPRVTYGHHECLLYFSPEPITKCQTHRSALLCNFHNLILTGIFTMHMDAYISVLQYDCNTLSAHNPGHNWTHVIGSKAYQGWQLRRTCLLSSWNHV